MKTTRNTLCALLLLGALPMAASAQLSIGGGVSIGSHGRASVDLGFFYDNLASYGNWIERPSYGWVWTPRAVSASWRPYQAGHWVWSDEGWTWLSDEPYGWATYHYGRWYQDPEIGWAWVPGNDWGPAWVSWQEGQDYVGWAPLPPGADVNASYNGGYDDGYGYDNGYDNGYGYDDGYDGGYGYDDSYAYGGGYGYGGGYAYGLAPSAYLFVPVRSFLSVSLFDFYLPWVRVSSFWGHTRNCTSYGFRGGRYYNWGVPFAHVQRYYHNVPRYQLSELNGFRDRGHRIEGNRIAFFRPQVQRTRGITPLDRPNARRSVMRADQFRAAFPDRVSRAQREGYNNNRQGFRAGEIQGGRNGRQGIVDYGQRYQRGQADGRYQGRDQVQRQQRQYNVPRAQDQAYGQRQYGVQRQSQDQGFRQQRQYDVPRNQGQVYRQQRQYDNQQRWQQNQVQRQQRQYVNQQRWQQQRQYNAPRVQERQERSYQPRQYNNNQSWQRQAPPQREYRAPNRGQENRGQNNGRGQSQDNGRRHGGRGHGGE
jgi:hypothetical protein